MVKRLFFVFVLFGFIELYAWEWIPFDKGVSEVTEPTVRKLSSSAFSLSFKAHIPGLRYRTVATDWMKDGTGEEFALFSFPRYAYTGEIGKPKLPMFTQVIEVPHGATLEVEIKDAKYEEISLGSLGVDYRIMPALAPVPKVSGARPEFVLDDEVYREDRYYPYKLVDVEEHGGYARGHKLATIQLFPVQYNPEKGGIIYYTDIEVEVRFIGGDIGETEDAIYLNYSSDWEGFIDRMVLNPNIFEDKGVPSLPIYYDIFYSSDFSEAAESLAIWKTQKGFKVRMWDASGWTATQIENTIDAQSPLATYLVIMADPNASNPLPSCNANTYSGQTDLYYAETDGSGYFPDMFKGRISVKTAEEAMTVVNKAIRYEKAIFGTAGYDWLKRATFIAGYDPYGNQTVGMATNRYCFNLLVNNAGYDPLDVDTLVMASGEQEGRVVNEINEGNIWMVYTAHGGETEWWVGYSGDFNVTELTNLTTNQDMYTMPCGHCCVANDFDYSTDCFGETWPKLSNRGGVSYYGSVPGTYWDEDDWLQRRYFDAIYTDSVPGRLYEMSRFTDWGLFWIENNTATTRKQYYFEGYHVMNDPSLQIWTDIPDTLHVSHNPIVPPGTSDFTVSVYDNDGITPVPEALVCCWVPSEDPDLHEVGYTDATGSVTISVSPAMAGEEMFVTVSKHDYFPNIDTVLVVIPASWTISPESVLVNTATPVTVTVKDSSNNNYPGVEIHINGYGVDLYDTTNASGEAVINVNAPYGENLLVIGRDTVETWNLFTDTLPVYGASGFITWSIDASCDTLGVTGHLVPNFSGTISSTANPAGYTLFASGCGIDTSASTIGGSLEMGVKPSSSGYLKATIAKGGYNIVSSLVDVKRVKAMLSGYVINEASGDSVANVLIKGYYHGSDTSSSSPVFELTADGNGYYGTLDSIYADYYDLYLKLFGYLPGDTTVLLRKGSNDKDLYIEPAPNGIVWGRVYEPSTGNGITSTIRVYRNDNGSLYTTAYSDSLSNGDYEVSLPYFDYTFRVRAYHYQPILRLVSVYNDSVNEDFKMNPTEGNILIIDDSSSKGNILRIEEELKQGEKEGVSSKSRAGAAADKFYGWLTGLGYSVDTTTTALTDTSEWNQYDFLIVSSGPNSAPLSSNNITTKLINWVNKDGKLLIEGGEIGYDWYGTSFGAQVLHITDWDSDNAGNLPKHNATHPLTTVPNTLADPLTISYSGYGDEDAVVLDSYAELIYGTTSYPSDAGILIFDPTPPIESGQTVYYAFNLDALSDTNDAKELIENTANYLLALEPPGPDTLYGHVELYDTPYDSGATVTARLGAAVFTGITDEYGNYEITGLYDGIYDITASKFGFADSSVSGVNITGNLGMNFTLYPIAILYHEDFEDSNGAYTATGDWEWGVPTSGPSGAHSGVNVWGTNLSGDYSALSNSRLTTVDIDLSGATHPTLSFYHWYDMEGDYTAYDGGNVKISVNGGAWEVLDNLNPPYNDIAYSTNAGIPGEPCYSSHGQGYWEEVTRDMSEYTDSVITLRFHFGSDGSIQYPGWYIDDVMIYGSTAGITTGEELPSVYSMVIDGIRLGSKFNIRYSLPEKAAVVFKVYDITGREIKHIRDVKEAGFYETRIDMSNRAAGVYFIRMEANKRVFTEKAVLIR